MPSNRTRRTRAPEPAVSESVRTYLLTGDHEKGGFEVFKLWGDWKAIKAIWDGIKEDLLAEWIRKHPGTRPWAWWECDAPRWARIFEAFWDGKLPEPRRRVGGRGTEDFECLAIVPDFAFGIPTGWITQADFTGVAIDPADPPRFESQAAYLDRHGLLTALERRRLAAHPELLEPEAVTCGEGGP